MNLSGYEFQVIFCVLIILSLASVALIVDYLKGMNEKLRERQIDLMARHETVVNRVEEDNTKLLRALAEQSKSFREMTRKSSRMSTFEVQQQFPELPARPAFEATPMRSITAGQPRITVPEVSVPAVPVLAASIPVSEIGPEPVISEPVIPDPVDSEPALASEEAHPSNVVRIRLKSINIQPDPSTSLKPPPDEPNFEKFLEDLVTEFEETPDLPVGDHVKSIENLALNLEAFESSLNVPAGSFPASTINQLLASKDRFSGLVVSIGINEYMQLEEIHGRAVAADLLNTVDAFMEEVAGEAGFCSRSSDDEFVLIFPKLTGAPAQQRLSEISERLWNYQLEALGTFSVLFSWGGSEAKRQTLASALNIARENMTETKSSRKTSTSDGGQKRRTAV